MKKHIKQGQGHEGGIFAVEAPLHASNVQVVDPVTGYAHLLKSMLVIASSGFEDNIYWINKVLLFQEALQSWS